MGKFDKKGSIKSNSMNVLIDSRKLREEHRRMVGQFLMPKELNFNLKISKLNEEEKCL